MEGMVLQSSFSELISGRLRRKLREVLPFSDIYESNSYSKLSITVKFTIRLVTSEINHVNNALVDDLDGLSQEGPANWDFPLISASTTVWRSKIIMNQYVWEMSIKIQFWKRFRCLTHNFTKKFLVNTIWFSLHQELFILSRDRITCDSRAGRIWIHFLGWYEVYKSSRSS